MPVLPTAALVGAATLGWFTVLGLLALLGRLPRFWFMLSHYVVDALVFGAIFWFVFKRFEGVAPFAGMAVAMVTMMVLEYVAWGLIYKGDRWFLTFEDWIVPAFIVASTIYFAGVHARG